MEQFCRDPSDCDRSLTTVLDVRETRLRTGVGGRSSGKTIVEAQGESTQIAARVACLSI